MTELVDHVDPILREAQPEFAGDFRALRTLADRMSAVMKQRRGIGLAAPQVGERVRMFVMQIGRRYVCVNPRVLEVLGEKVTRLEGCLTRPGREDPVARHEHIVAQWTDLLGQECCAEFAGLPARCFQHELDHLNGVCIWGDDA